MNKFERMCDMMALVTIIIGLSLLLVLLFL